MNAISCTITKVIKSRGQDSYLVFYIPDDTTFEKHMQTMKNMNVNRDIERIQPGTHVVLGWRQEKHWNNPRIVAMDGVTRLPV